MPEQKTKVENIVTKLKNNRVVAIIIVFGITIIALSRFTDATHKIIQQIQGFFSDRPAVVNLRHKPEILSSDMVKVLLAKHGFYEQRWNPSGKGIAHRYESQIRGNAVLLFDAATGLMWQKGGSSSPMTFEDAEQYVHRINGDKFAGFNDWRLPTVEEAISLLEPQAYDRFHIDPEFEREINFIWTSDRAADGRIWMLYFYDGMLGMEMDSFNAWVRVVR
jgi:hypothetical protein